MRGGFPAPVSILGSNATEMGFFSNVKKSFFQRRLLKELERRQPQRDPQEVNPATASCVAVLFPADDVNARRIVERYKESRRREGLRTELMGFFQREINEAGVGFDHFSSKDLNWYGVPQGSDVDKFLSRSCDLLITLGPAGQYQLDYLAALKDTGLRVGPYTGETDNPYDVQFGAGRSNKPDFQEQLRQIENIFKVTNATSLLAAV